MKWFKENYLDNDDSLNILDVGSLDNSGKNYNYKSTFDSSNWRYDGLDFENGDNVDILVDDIYNWDMIPNKSYDVVISGQFFTHLKYFWKVMSEIDRVLKDGGIICIIAPSAGPKHGAVNKDCYRFYEDGFGALAKYVNFEILHLSTNITAIPWCDTCLIAKK